jgi:hypothetical protein
VVPIAKPKKTNKLFQEGIMLKALRGESKLFFLALPLLLALVSGAYADQSCELCHGPNGPHLPQCGDATTCGVSCHQGKLEYMMHPSGAGTPMSNVTTTTGIASACNTCHQLPFATHPFRINTNPGTVSVYPGVAQVCGQCHGGGTDSVANPPATGDVYLTTNQLAVAASNIHSGATTTLLNSMDCTLCHNGAPIAPAVVRHHTVTGTPGTGAAACRSCHLANGTLHRKAAVNEDKVCGQCHGGSLGEGAVVSPAPYFTVTQLAEAAKTMHSSDVSATDCTMCHNASSTPAIIQGTNHHSGACATCHATLHQGVVNACANCHTMAITNHNTVPTCLTCHSSAYGAHPGVVPTADQVCNQCHGGSSGTTTHNGADYKTAFELTSLAPNMHGFAPTARFSWTVDSAKDYNVLYDASSSTCPSGATCAYSWAFGDGASGSGVSTSHAYGDATPRTVTLTVSNRSVTVSYSLSVIPQFVGSNKVVVSAPLLNVVGSTLTLTDVSAGGTGVITAKVSWGDGTTTTMTGHNQVFGPHPYSQAITYNGSIYVTDSGVNGQYRTSDTKPFSVTFAPMAISGLVTKNTGSVLSGVSLVLKLGGVAKKLSTSAANGRYTFSNVAPGTYTITATKTGYLFTDPAVSGVSATTTNADIQAQ